MENSYLSNRRMRPIELTGDSYIQSKKPDLWVSSDYGIGSSGARSFNGVDQFFVASTSTDMDVAVDEDFWISGWVKITSHVNYRTIFATGSASSSIEGFWLSVTSTGTIKFWMVAVSGARFTVTTVDSIQAGVWAHIAVTVDRDGNAIIYINGVAKATSDVSSYSQAINASLGAALIGSSSTSIQYPMLGDMSRVCWGKGVLPDASQITELYNSGNGKFTAEFSSGLRAITSNSWNLNSASGDARDTIGTLDAAEKTPPQGASTGPNVATASDLEGGYHGTLTGFSDPIVPWSSDTPDGSYSAVKADNIGSNDATMTNFTDVDAAHVDGPEGSWGPHVPDQGSGGNDGWLIGGVKDSRSADVPSGKFVGGATKAFDTKENYDCSLVGFTESPRSTDIPSQLSGVKSIAFGSSAKALQTAATAITGQGARTLSCWFKVADTSAGSAILMAETDGGIVGSLLYLNTSGYIVWSIKGAATLFSITAAIAYDDNAWHQATASFDGTTDIDGAKLYVDGVQIATGTSAAVSQGSDAGVFQNGNHATTYTLPGSLCLPSVTAGRAWTAAEVTAHYTDGTLPTDVAASWSFTEADTCGLTVDYSLDNDATRSVETSLTGPSLTEWTISIWTQPSDVTVGKYISDSGPGNVAAILNGYQSGYYNIFGSKYPTNDPLDSQIPASGNGIWDHVVWTRSGSSIKGYVNGILHSSVTITIGDFDVRDALFIGQSAAGTTYTGKIGLYEVHASALTQAQIRQLAQGLSVDSPVGKWEFDQTINLPYLSQDKAIEFEGTSDYADCGTDIAGFTSEDFSISIWVKTPPNSVHKYMLSRALYYVNGWVISADIGQIRFATFQSSAQQFTWSAGRIDDNVWHNVTVVRVGGVATVFIDGVDDTGVANTHIDPVSPVRPLIFGHDAPGLPCQFADPRIYNAALTESQIRDIISGTDYRTNLAAEWAFDDSPRSIASCAGGYSLRTTTVGDHVAVTSGPVTESSNWTISLWAKANKLISGSAYFIDFSSPRVVIGLSAALADGVIGWYDDLAWIGAGTERIDDGTWHCVTLVKTGTAFELYVDGSLYSSGTCQDVAINSAAFKFPGSSYEFDGRTDDVRVYDTALSVVDIATLVAGNEPSTTPVAHWTLDDGPQFGTINDGDPITTLITKDSNHYKFNQATVANRSLYVASAANGRPGMSFDGLSDYLLHEGNILTEPQGTIIVVLQADDVTSSDAFFTQADDSATNEFNSLNINASTFRSYVNDAGVATTLTGGTPVNSTTYIIEYSSDGSTIATKVNNTLLGLTGTNDGKWFGDISSNNTVIGALLTSAGATSFFDGYIMEIIAWDGIADPDNISKIVTNLSKKYNITLS